MDGNWISVCEESDLDIHVARYLNLDDLFDFLMTSAYLFRWSEWDTHPTFWVICLRYGDKTTGHHGITINRIPEVQLLLEWMGEQSCLKSEKNRAPCQERKRNARQNSGIRVWKATVSETLCKGTAIFDYTAIELCRPFELMFFWEWNSTSCLPGKYEPVLGPQGEK